MTEAVQLGTGRGLRQNVSLCHFSDTPSAITGTPSATVGSGNRVPESLPKLLGKPTVFKPSLGTLFVRLHRIQPFLFPNYSLLPSSVIL